MNPPAVGSIVLYRSRTGSYTVPAIITATTGSLNQAGIEAGHVPALTGADNVHLTVFTPGKPGMRGGAGDFIVESSEPRSENVSGCYQEWDIPSAGSEQFSAPINDDFPAGTWAYSSTQCA